MVKGPGPIDKRFADGGTPTTYPADGTSFLLPLAPPYDKATVVTCGATWAYFKPGGRDCGIHLCNAQRGPATCALILLLLHTQVLGQQHADGRHTFFKARDPLSMLVLSYMFW